jgi:cobalt-zinc-cadmium efflux system membrane fusion protein
LKALRGEERQRFWGIEGVVATHNESGYVHENAPPVVAEAGSSLAQITGTVVAIGALAAMAFWGHRTGWRFASTRKPVEAQTVSETIRVTINERNPGAACRLHGIVVCPQCKTETGSPDGRPKGNVAASERRPPSNLLHEVSLDVGSPEKAETLGIDITPVWKNDIAETIEAPGELQLDPRRVARVSARVAGVVSQVNVKQGDVVKAGSLLAVIDSAEIGRLKTELLRAIAQVRFRTIALADIERAGTAATNAQRRDAESALEAADVKLESVEQAIANLRLPLNKADLGNAPLEQLADKLRYLGLPQETAGSESANLFPVVAPQDGVVLTSDVVAGEKADAARILFVVGDVSQLIAVMHVNVSDGGRLKIGLPARFRPDAAASDAAGRIEGVASAADEATRTLLVRVAIDNSNRQLRASTLGSGRIILRETPNAIVVPNAAVTFIDDWPVVFVRDPRFLKPDGAKSFSLRPVRIGTKDVSYTEVLAGVEVGEIVASKGVALLAAEYLRHVSVRKITASKEKSNVR